MYAFLQQHPRIARVLELIGWSVAINVLVLVTCLTIIGIAPAIGAAFAFLSRLVRGEPADLVEHYAKNLPALFWRSWAALFAVAAPAGLAVVNAQLVTAAHIPFGDVAAAVGLLAGLLALLGGLYLWPLVTIVDRPLLALVPLSLQLALGHLPWSLGTLAVVAMIVSVSFAVPAFGGVLGFGLTITVVSLAGWRIIARYARPAPAQP